MIKNIEEKYRRKIIIYKIINLYIVINIGKKYPINLYFYIIFIYFFIDIIYNKKII